MDKSLLVSYIESGLSIYSIGKRVNKSYSAIRYWLIKYNLKTKHKSFKNGYHGDTTNEFEVVLCSSCGVEITSDNGYKRKGRKRKIFHRECKKCISDKTKLKRKKSKEKAIEYKGGSCDYCGYNKNSASLEFHHLNPLEKDEHPSKMIGKDWENLKKEIDKCILLCSNCHREEHQKIDDRISLENNFKDFQLSNFSSNILTGKNTGKMSCYMCDIVLTEENLVSKKHTPLCKSCNSKRTVNRIKTNKIKAVEYMGGKCSHCGYNKCLRALEFHHLDPSKKSEDYDKNFTTWGVERQKEELKNCILLCSNCHREVHNSEPS